MSVLSINNLTKVYGRNTAVDNLKLTIESGKAFGLLGPNGSGKTTTLSMLLGVANASSGSFEWFGGIKGAAARRNIGAILEQPVFYPGLSAAQNLKIVAHIKRLDQPKIDEALEFTGLLSRKRDKFKTYSLGMKQRLAIASALLADPKVLILDEPTNGLDPEGIADIRTMIQKIVAGGKTLILASHLLDEVQKICSDFIILNKGKTLYRGNVEDDLNSKGQYIISAEDLNSLMELANNAVFISKAESIDGVIKIKAEEGISAAEMNKYFAEKGVYLNTLSPQKNRLEEKFLDVLNQKA